MFDQLSSSAAALPSMGERRSDPSATLLSLLVPSERPVCGNLDACSYTGAARCRGGLAARDGRVTCAMYRGRDCRGSRVNPGVEGRRCWRFYEPRGVWIGFQSASERLPGGGTQRGPVAFRMIGVLARRVDDSPYPAAV
jgi:hypothetical protein